jgi:PAS domain S-box-containing protein
METRHQETLAGEAGLPLPEADEAFRPAVIPSPSLYRTLLENMIEGVSLSAEDGTIVYTNPAEDRMFGYGPGELVGQHVSVQNAYPPEQNARLVDEVIAELKRSGHWRGEWLNRRKDGSAFVTTSRISAVEIEGRAHWLWSRRMSPPTGRRLSRCATAKHAWRWQPLQPISGYGTETSLRAI